MNRAIWNTLYGSYPLNEVDYERNPYRHLMLAILHRAVMDLSVHGDDRQHKRQSIAWILNGNTGKFTFDYIVEYINLSSDQITYIKELAEKAAEG